MPTYNICMFYPKEKESRLEPIHGYPVSLPELDGVDLFIHRPSTGIMGSQSWSISEVKTGLALISNCIGTKQQALDALKARLYQLPTQDIKAYVQQILDERIAFYGVANPND